MQPFGGPRRIIPGSPRRPRPSRIFLCRYGSSPAGSCRDIFDGILPPDRNSQRFDFVTTAGRNASEETRRSFLLWGGRRIRRSKFPFVLRAGICALTVERGRITPRNRVEQECKRQTADRKRRGRFPHGPCSACTPLRMSGFVRLPVCIAASWINAADRGDLFSIPKAPAREIDFWPLKGPPDPNFGPLTRRADNSKICRIR